MAQWDPEHKKLLIASWASPMQRTEFPPAKGCSQSSGVEGTHRPLSDTVDDGTYQVCATHAALEASLQEESSSTSAGGAISVGKIGEFITIDQFHNHWKSLVKKWEMPSAFCGALAPAYVQLLLNLMSTGLLPKTSPGQVYAPIETDLLLEIIKSSDTLCATAAGSNNNPLWAQLDRMMGYFNHCRTTWRDEHPNRFPVAKEKRDYIRNWIANYELSDALRFLMTEEKNQKSEQKGGKLEPPHSLLKHVAFLRGNQWPEYGVAKQEERDRMVEEERFGGHAEKENGVVKYKTELGERAVIVELPWLADPSSHSGSPATTSTATAGGGGADQENAIDVDASQSQGGPTTATKSNTTKTKAQGPLLTPDEFSSDYAAEMPWPRIVVVDLLGHYATALCYKEEVPATGKLEPRTILLNTMLPGKAEHHMLALTHYMFACGLAS